MRLRPQENLGQYQINFDESLVLKDSKGRDKAKVMKDSHLANENILSFDEAKKEWLIDGMLADDWKKKMDLIYEKDKDYGKN